MQATKTLTKIIKRSGSKEPFAPYKITRAIFKAGKATGEFDQETAKRLTVRVVNLIHQLIEDHAPSVEEIQDIVEDVLITSPYRKTAKAYILYREQHAQIREIANKFNTDLVSRYLNKDDWRVNENSNMAFSLQGLNQYISSEISKTYWLNKVYPDEIK